jgi:F-type H+-transporting ATPase subunit alpha
VIYCGVNGLLENVPMDKVAEFEELFIQLLKAKYQNEVLDMLKAGKLTDDVTAKLTQCAKEIANKYKA